MTTVGIEPSTSDLRDRCTNHSATEDYKDWLSNYQITPHTQVSVRVV